MQGTHIEQSSIQNGQRSKDGRIRAALARSGWKTARCGCLQGPNPDYELTRMSGRPTLRFCCLLQYSLLTLRRAPSTQARSAGAPLIEELNDWKNSEAWPPRH